MSDLDEKLREILGSHLYNERWVNKVLPHIKPLFKEHSWEEQDGDS